ncbi:MAG: hypothetical protein QX191_08820 [Methylococcaceae bacterium]
MRYPLRTSVLSFVGINTQSRLLSAVQQGLDDVQAGRVIDDMLDVVLEGKIAKL